MSDSRDLPHVFDVLDWLEMDDISREQCWRVADWVRWADKKLSDLVVIEEKANEIATLASSENKNA